MLRPALLCAATVLLAGCSSRPTEAVPSNAPTAAVTHATRASKPGTTAPPHGTTPAPTAGSSSGRPHRASQMPKLAHVVIAVLENHSADQVLNNPAAPFLQSLTSSGVSLTNMQALTHPSEPNYLALFSGSTHGLTSDACPVRLSGPNLASELATQGYTFTGYSEGLPSVGFQGCSAGEYARKHNPWVDFTNLPATVNQTMTAFPTDYARLPTVSFVVPDLMHDMHDGTITQADTWLAAHLGGFAKWAPRHDSLLIITWDENNGDPGNHIATILFGAGIVPGTAGQPVTHLSLLRSLENAYRLPPLAASARATPIVGVWKPQ